MRDDLYFLKLHIDDLFKKHLERDINENMISISQYYQYFAENLDSDKLLELDQELIKSFESVYLWLRDKLVLYPSTIKSQIENIVKDNKLLELFGILSFLSEEELQRTRKRLRYQEFPFFISFFINIFYRLPKIENVNDKLLTTENVLNSKIALNRLAQVVKFASSFEVTDYDESYSSFKEHYNPNLIDKSKVIALINIIKVQSNELSDTENKQKILDKLEKIEAEVNKKKVRWSSVFVGLFMLLGFLADLKTVSPIMYDKVYDTTSKVINVMLEDGQVQKQQKFKLHEYNIEPQDTTDVKDDKKLIK